jgi:hypothetical protein
MRALALLILAAVGAWAQLPVSLGFQVSSVRANSNQGFGGGLYGELSLPVIPAIRSGILFRENLFVPGGGYMADIPVLLKKGFGLPAPVKPYVMGGAVFRRVSALDRNTTGISVGAGITIRALIVKLEPEVRFTRFTSQGIGSEVDFTLGFRF